MRIKNLKKVPFEIATMLANNSKICSLLYIDSKDAAVNQMVTPIPVQKLIDENYISFKPFVETGIEATTRNTFIIINLENFSLESNNNNNTIVEGIIYVTTDFSHLLLENNHLRLLELVDEIETTLNNQKLSSAGIITLSTVNYSTTSAFRGGYAIHFRCADLVARKAEL